MITRRRNRLRRQIEEVNTELHGLIGDMGEPVEPVVRPVKDAARVGGDVLGQVQDAGEWLDDFPLEQEQGDDGQPAALIDQDIPGLAEEDDYDEEEVPAESMALYLPSNLPADAPHRDLELSLRVAQLDETVSKLKMAISYKSMVYSSGVRQARNSQQRKTRAQRDIQLADLKIKESFWVYRRCQAAFKNLSPGEQLLGRYKDITLDDLRCSTSVTSRIDAQGIQRSQMTIKSLAWFWSLGGPATSSPEWLEQCKHIPAFPSRSL